MPVVCSNAATEFTGSGLWWVFSTFNFVVVALASVAAGVRTKKPPLPAGIVKPMQLVKLSADT